MKTATKVKEYVTKKAPWNKPFVAEAFKKPKTVYNPQEVYGSIEKIKSDLKKAREEMKANYMEDPEFAKLVDQILPLLEKRKGARIRINEKYSKVIDRMSNLKLDLEEKKKILTDILFVAMTKGETVEIKDKYEQQILPIFSVKLIKQ